MKITILLIATLLEVYDLYRDYTTPLSNKILGKAFLVFRVIIILLLVYFVISELINNEKEKKISATHGEFGDQKDANSSFPVLTIGGASGAGNVHNLTFAGDPVDPINIKEENGQISLSANIRDSKGDIYAIISGRTWEVNNLNSIDYNNDDSAFEIITGGRVVFQVDLKINHAIVNGMICSESGFCTFGYQEKLDILPKQEGTQRFILPSQIDIKPIFKYPRSKYLGVRESIRN
jgi:hypothetical protein